MNSKGDVNEKSNDPYLTSDTTIQALSFMRSGRIDL